jgi:hypothetical protein
VVGGGFLDRAVAEVEPGLEIELIEAFGDD